LHGKVTREMFPGYEIGHITNGVHHLSWTGPEYARLYDQFLPHWRSYPEVLGSAMLIPDEILVEAKQAAKRRLINLTRNRVQFVFSGKAHPQDEAGKRLVQDIIHTGRTYEGRLRLVYLRNYNIWQAALLTQGVDIWLNNPRRPREAQAPVA
ncbi:MAG: glgP, partial [Deltaproteobacteria bacterium]|nr:glgP [Deltaproteobacteria bacterium]